MFNPFASRGRAQPPTSSRAFGVWAAVVAISLGVAFLLRNVAIDNLYIREVRSPDVTAVSLDARTDAQIAAMMESALTSADVQGWLGQEQNASLFLQIVSGSSQLKHLLIDLGMKGDALDTIESGDKADYTVISRVVPRSEALGGERDPLAFGTRIEPVFLVRSEDGQNLSVRELRGGDFHPDFARLRF